MAGIEKNSARVCVLVLLLIPSLLFFLSACGVDIGDEDYGYMEGTWTVGGAPDAASVTFFTDGSWKSTGSDGEALGSGTYTISDGHLLLLRNDDGTYAVSIVVHDKNTFTLGDGGTEYKRLND